MKTPEAKNLTLREDKLVQEPVTVKEIMIRQDLLEIDECEVKDEEKV